MKDLILVIWGGKHCGWCNRDKVPTIMERLLRLDQILMRSERPLHERVLMKVYDFNTMTLPIWKLGQRWHYKFHRRNDG